jgi:uncharacterized protein (DUF362 family)
MVRGTDWVAATQAAIAAAGGLPDLSGKNVMLKISAINGTANYTTAATVISGVIAAVKAASKGAAPIITVADDGYAAGGNTLGAMQTLGITAVCTAAGATAMDLSKQTYTTRNGIDFSDPVYNADYVIAVAPCKHHEQVFCHYSMALKVWYGNTQKNRSHTDSTMPAKLYAIKPANFTVIDATKCCIDQGPSTGTIKQSQIVVASKDAIAADVTGLFILKYNGCTDTAATDAWNNAVIKGALAQKIPGYLTASSQFTYVAQGVTEAATIMGY